MRITKPWLAAIILGTVPSSQSQALEWEITTIDQGGKPSLDLTSDGNPQISYMTEALTGFVRHAIWNGSSWDIQEVTRGYFYGPLALAIDSDDRPHIAYHDHQDLQFQDDKGDQVHAFWDGSQWQRQTVTHPGHDGWDNAIAMDGLTPKTASVDPVQFGRQDGIEYWDGQQVEAIGSGPVAYEYGTSIAIGSDGTPHISYLDTAQGQLKYATRRNGRWTITTVDAQTGSGLYSSILIGADGAPQISYFRQGSGRAGSIQYARLGSSGWTLQEVDQLDNVVTGMVGARNVTSLALDTEGNPTISYADMSTLKFAAWNGSQWETETVVEGPSSGSVLGGLTSQKIGPDGTVHITFYEMPDNFGTTTGSVRYARGAIPNSAPTFVELVDREISENTPLNLPVSAIDPENSELTITATNLPEGATFSDGDLTWTPTFAQEGTYTIIFTATDGTLSTTQEVTISVQHVNVPVVLSRVSPDKGTILVQSGDSVLFEIETEDPDNDSITISWSVNGQDIIGATERTFSFDSTEAEEDRISVTVSDGTDSVDYDWFAVKMLKGDFDTSGNVNFADFLTFVSGFGLREGELDYNPALDIEPNGAIDFADFLTFVRFFGTGSWDLGQICWAFDGAILSLI